MGFAYPKEEREALVASDPDKFLHAGPVRHALQLGGRPARRDRRAGDARAGDRRLADGRAEASRRRSPRRRRCSHGGMANPGAVVRIGDEVRRPSSPHTESIFALVRHARDRGFTEAPEPLGLDELGRERWEFVPGDVPLPPFPTWSQTDELLASTAALLRRFHDAVADFVAPSDAVWNNELAFVHATAGRAPSPSALVVRPQRRVPGERDLP